MGMGSVVWNRFAVLRTEWEHKGWYLAHSYRAPSGRRYNFAARRIFSRANLGDPVPFQSLDDLLKYVQSQPTETENIPLPPVVVIPNQQVVSRVRRRAR